MAIPQGKLVIISGPEKRRQRAKSLAFHQNGEVNFREKRAEGFIPSA
jgi:hypothetical protein